LYQNSTTFKDFYILLLALIGKA